VREWSVVVLFASPGISREQALTFCFSAFAADLSKAIGWRRRLRFTSTAAAAERHSAVARRRLNVSRSHQWRFYVAS